MADASVKWQMPQSNGRCLNQMADAVLSTAIRLMIHKGPLDGSLIFRIRTPIVKSEVVNLCSLLIAPVDAAVPLILWRGGFDFKGS
jgi:hypothetical protein